LDDIVARQDFLSKFNLSKSKSESTASLSVIQEFGLFEAYRIANPVLPQYHPKLLMELLNSGKTRRVKAILSHLVRCNLLKLNLDKFVSELLRDKLFKCLKLGMEYDGFNFATDFEDCILFMLYTVKLASSKVLLSKSLSDTSVFLAEFLHCE
jgi:hypothetical protein